MSVLLADGAGGPEVEVRFALDAELTARALRDAWPGAGEASGPLVVDGVTRSDALPLTACGLAHGAEVRIGPLPPEPDRLTVVGGPLSPVTAALDGPLLIGRGVGCGLVLDHPSVAAAHVLVEPGAGAGGWTVCALAAAALDGEPVAGPVALRAGSVLAVGAVDLQLVPAAAPAAVVPPAAPIHRSAPPPQEPVDDPPPLGAPPQAAPPPVPPGALTVVLPMALGVVLALTVHPAAAAVTALSPLLALGSHADARRRHRRDTRRSEAEHAAARAAHREATEVARRRRARAARADHPTVADALVRARRGERLWGAAPDPVGGFPVAVGWTADAARDPVVVPLDDNHRLGVAGPPAWAEAAARSALVALTARWGPRDLGLAVEDPTRAPFLRWLPHGRGTGPSLAVTADGPVEVATDRSGLSDHCRHLLLWTADGAVLEAVGAGAGPVPVQPMVADGDLAERYGRASARWRDPAAGGGLPERVALGPLLGETAPAGERERTSLTAVVGMTTEGPAALDLVADGPHALVAGTTGAGKSELLRTWIVALAAVHPPEALTFLLVDYKGGSAFDACTGLPHTSGVVTDLDPGLAERVLVSLRAEVRQREQALRAEGHGDLADWAGGPPRLVVVVDEFATLAAELPDFLASLVDVARRGRSLGVHLVLATQRPGGAVSDDIRANTALRVCLRTLDGADSQEVLGGPEAAALPAGTPGRAWVRTATGTHLVQVASTAEWAGAGRAAISVRRARRGSPEVDADDEPRRLAAVIERVRQHWHGHAAARPVWHPPLPERLAPDTVDDETAVVLGRIDRVAEREQAPLLWHPTEGHLLVLGGRRSGTTTALCTATRGLAGRPDRPVHVFVVAAGHGLDHLLALPGVHAVVPADDRVTTQRLLGRLAAGAHPVPATLVVDDLDRLLGDDDLEGLRLREGVDRLARRGPADGLTLAVGASRPLRLPPGLLPSATTVVVLALDDPADHGLVGLRPPPRRPPPGRGQTLDGDLVQVAVTDRLPRCSPPEVEPPGPSPVEPLPEAVSLAGPAHPGRFTVGLRDRDLRPAVVDWRADSPFVIAGPPRSGRSNALDLLLGQAPAVHRTVHRPGADPGRLGAGLAAWLADPTPHLFALDDADLLDDPEGHLRTLVTRRHPDALVVLTLRADAWRGAYGTWLDALRPATRGLALAADPVRDVEAWAVPLPALGPGPPPGRGVLVADGTVDVVQVAGAH